MATAQGTVRFHRQEQTVTFRVEGRGTMAQSMPLRRCVDRFLDGGVNRVCVDLRECTYMDSTFLGTLLTLKKNVAQRARGDVVLLAPSQACSKILHQMGLSDVLPAHAAEVDPDASWTPLVCEGDDPHSFKRNIAQAHEELASLPGPAGEQFKAVVRCMAQAEKDKPAGQSSAPPKE